MNQLFDRHNATIAKSLLLQLDLQTSFIQFRSELSIILGMQNKKEHGKTTAVTISQCDQKGENYLEGLSKNQSKKLAKISAQTAQIKDLRVKLDSAVAENTQMPEYLDPKNFQTCNTNVIQEVQRTASWINQSDQRYILCQSRPYAGIL